MELCDNAFINLSNNGILTDKEIRKLSFDPDSFHAYGGQPFFSLMGGAYYYLTNGKECTEELFIKYGLNEKWINPIKAADGYEPMIWPFEPKQVRHDFKGNKIISYGTSSMGYDVRLANKFKIFTNVYNALIDPLNMPETSYIDHEGDFVIIPPNSYVLGHTVEHFNMPRNVMGICFGKSSLARVGCSVNVTPIEPGFKGQIVIEISNQTPLPMKVYAEQGISQFIFLRGDECEISYGDRSGKYQNQKGIQTALV